MANRLLHGVRRFGGALPCDKRGSFLAYVPPVTRGKPKSLDLVWTTYRRWDKVNHIHK